MIRKLNRYLSTLLNKRASIKEKIRRRIKTSQKRIFKYEEFIYLITFEFENTYQNVTLLYTVSVVL